MSSSVHSYPSIAGKVFLLGEYAVLGGLPAVVAATSPRFKLEPSPESYTQYASGSPAGRYLRWAYKDPSDILRTFHDPLQGAGGFGASTAQFALLVREILGDVDWHRAWSLYRELMAPAPGSEEIPPSGADLVAQWQGGVQLFDPKAETTEDLTQAFDWSQFMIFSATGIPGRKVATHTHLADLRARGFEFLRSPLEAGIAAIRRKDSRALGEALGAYADALHQNGLENTSAFEDRQLLKKLPGVLGVKGAGAMQADAMILLCEKTADRSMILKTAQARGLVLISETRFPETGIQSH